MALARLGYTDIDCGTINWTARPYLYFDKNSTFPIGIWGSAEIRRRAEICFRQSYRKLPPGTWRRLALAQASGDVQVIEDAYAATAREL